MTPSPTKASHLALFAALLVGVTTAGAFAAAPALAPQAAIATRQAGFKKMGAAMKVLGDQLKSDAPAKAAMLPAAQTILATAREQGKLFPAGSGPASGLKTDALPGIWTDRATFDAKMAELVVESGKLVSVTKGGEATAIRAQFKATGATCGGCHRQFRSES